MCYISKVVTLIISNDKYRFKKFSLCPQNVLVCFEGCKNPNVSIRPSSSAYPCQGHTVGGQRTPWKSCQSIAGLTHRDRQLSTLTFTALANLELLINLTACLGLWEEAGVPGENIWAVEDSIVFDIFYIVILYRYKDTNVGGPDLH